MTLLAVAYTSEQTIDSNPYTVLTENAGLYQRIGCSAKSRTLVSTHHTWQFLM